jgi:hypothetical protein
VFNVNELNAIILNVIMLKCGLFNVIILSVIILDVIMLNYGLFNVVILNVNILNVNILNVIILNVIMLNNGYIRKDCFQNKSKFITENHFVNHMNIAMHCLKLN